MSASDSISEAVVVGATGFIGSALLGELRRRGLPVVGMARGYTANLGPGIVCADLATPASFASKIPEGSAVVHAASYVGSDAEQSELINVTGTRNLITAARDAGVKHLIYVSTTGVYGNGPHRNLDVASAPIRPASMRSKHRRVAEEMVLAAGGTVVRPHLTYGVGDRWVVPALIALPQIAGGIIDGGAAMTSIISVTALAALLSELLLEPADAIAGCALHAVHPTPITIRELTVLASNVTAARVPLVPVPLENVHPKLRAAGYSDHQTDMAVSDHWYTPDTSTIARVTKNSPPFALTEQDITWYQDLFSLRRGPLPRQ